MTGNGPLDIDVGGHDVGDSFVRLTTTRSGVTFSEQPADYFAPSNQAFLDSIDGDLGSGGLMLMPQQAGTSTPNLVLGGGKAAILHVLDRDNLGGFTGRNDPAAPDNAVQDVPGFGGGFWSTPAYWGSDAGHFVYTDGVNDTLRQLRVGVGLNGRSQLTPVSATTTTYGYPSASPVVSSNAGRAGTGIVWTLSRQTGALHAHDASNVATELWSSSMAPGDALTGGVVKFTVPTVASGRVYVGDDGHLIVYGLR